MLLKSFLPTGCVIEKVTVYPSDYGLEEMAKESTHGPSVFRKDDKAAAGMEDSDDSDEDSDDGKENQDAVNQDALRAYELQRLKYFYAIVECDSVKTAVALYTECDGLELESSSNMLDLRYVPEGTTFDNAPRDTANKVSFSFFFFFFHKLYIASCVHLLVWFLFPPASVGHYFTCSPFHYVS